MIQLGDIAAVNGYAVPPVDAVTGGSPCQDVSVAGARKGIRHKDLGDEAETRSGLFMEQIRVIRELRDADRKRGRTGQFIRPQFMLWENVPGAFSSNGGRDFQTVLTECVKIAEPSAPDVPLPEKGWERAGVLMGDGFSVAWRVLDAQYWGVAQRRRRIALVCDFGGQSAAEILFVPGSLSGDFTAGGTPGKGVAGAVTDCAYPAVARTLTSRFDGSPCVDRGPNVIVTPSDATFCIQGNAIDRDAKMNGSGISPGPMFTLNTVDRHAVYDARGNGDGRTVNTLAGDHESRVTDYTALAVAVHQNQNGEVRAGAVANTLSTNGNASGRNAPLIAIGLDSEHNACAERYGTLRAHSSGGAEGAVMVAVNCRDGTETAVNGTLQANGNSLNANVTVRQNGGVRRLTPLECERLQGFPDGWTDIGPWTDSRGRRRKCSDTARYRALGNSIALPPWKWVLKRIAAQYERDATLGSLFDGIGGFPLIWEQLNGKGSALWASEIEEFPIAVTRYRLGGG